MYKAFLFFVECQHTHRDLSLFTTATMIFGKMNRDSQLGLIQSLRDTIQTLEQLVKE